MLKNKGINLKSFLLIKVGAITDVPSTRTFSWLAIFAWVFSGVTFIRYIRSRPSISHPHALQSFPFMSIFGCNCHPVCSFTSHLFDSQVPFIGPYFIYTLLFILHFSTSAPIYFSCTPLFHSRSSYVIPLYFPSERFLSNLRVCFEFIPGLFEKTSENPL